MYRKTPLLISNYLYKSFESCNLDDNWKRISVGKPKIYKAESDNSEIVLQNLNAGTPESLAFKKDAVISLRDKILKFKDKETK